MKKPLPAGARRYQEALRNGDNAAIIAMRKAAERTRARKKAEREGVQTPKSAPPPVAEKPKELPPLDTLESLDMLYDEGLRQREEEAARAAADNALYDEGIRQRDVEAELQKRIDGGEVKLEGKTGETIPLFEEPEDY